MSMMRHPDDPWDVIVVGAGPAGSASARVAAERGAQVLLLDKASFPRFKTCAGGLVGTSVALLPERTNRTIERYVDGVELSRSLGRAHTRSSAEPLLHMVQRDRFDQANVDAAVAAGVDFRDGTNVRRIEILSNELVRVTTSEHVFTGRLVIGADGAGGRVGRFVGAVMGGVDLGLELEIPDPHGTPSRNIISLDMGRRAGTYAWVFPKNGSLTVGVIERKGFSAETASYLDDWVQRRGLDASTATRSRGHLTQWRAPRSALRRGNVILAGETAGLLEPWTREGISFALRSGIWAGEATAEYINGDVVALDRYVGRVEAELEPEIAAGRRFLSIQTRHPLIVHRAITFTPIGTSYLFGFCRGTASLADLFSDPVFDTMARLLSS